MGKRARPFRLAQDEAVITAWAEYAHGPGWSNAPLWVLIRQADKTYRVDEAVITAWAEYAHGPGWSNAPLWVLIRQADKTYRVECIQPEDHTATIVTLYPIADMVQSRLKSSVEAMVKP